MHSFKKKRRFLCMAWLATVNSTSMVHEIVNISTNLSYLLLHDFYYLTDCGIQLSRASPRYSQKLE